MKPYKTPFLSFRNKDNRDLYISMVVVYQSGCYVLIKSPLMWITIVPGPLQNIEIIWFQFRFGFYLLPIL